MCGLQIHALGFNFGVWEPTDACMSLWQENKTEKQRVFKPEKNRQMPHFQHVFTALHFFKKNIKRVFLKLDSMINILQLEFLQLDFVC